MPRGAPLTPVSSTEIYSKDGSQSTSIQMSFELPPPAVADTRASTASTKSSPASSSSYQPTSPKSPAISKTRRKSSVAQGPPKEAFALPPPPSRSRKIIQMKPRVQNQPDVSSDLNNDLSGKAAPAPKKKQPSSTSVAGRKIARKTAHSLIERRRRSKMNEEFGVLKDMIPACSGEMHKLAILQASIDYVRYLEDCVAKLQTENSRSTSDSALEKEKAMLPPTAKVESYTASQPQRHGEDADSDVEMEGADEETRPSPPAQTSSTTHSQLPSLSPAIQPQDAKARQDSYSSVSTDPRRYSFTASATTSPALVAGAYDYARISRPGSVLTSPALGPQRDRDFDHEATAALLMLNTDRRGCGNSNGGRGMSVKDLLSS